MKKILPTLSTCLFTASLFLAAPALRAQDGGHDKSPLQQEMDGMGHDVKSLRKMVADPAQKDAAVALAQDMEARATKAEGDEPDKAKKVPPADHDQFIADYKKQMEVLIGDIKKLEDALKAGNSTDASAILDQLNMDKRDGHKKFNADNH